MDIFFLDKSELAELEAVDKGYRNDVFIKITNKTYNVRVYSFIRLRQDFESEIEAYGYYSVDPNLVIVNNTSKEEIINTINRLFEQGYFNEIKPIQVD